MRATAVRSKVRFTEPLWMQEVSEESFITHFPSFTSSIWLKRLEFSRIGICMHRASTNKEQVFACMAFLNVISLLPPAIFSGAKGLFEVILMFVSGWMSVCVVDNGRHDQLWLKSQRAIWNGLIASVTYTILSQAKQENGERAVFVQLWVWMLREASNR